MKIVEIFGEERDDAYTKLREGCRGIVICDGKILLSYEKNINHYLIPGGGIEEGESLAECCEREIGEEAGIKVDAHTHYLTLEEYYHEYYFKSHYFVCKYLGECERALTKNEIANGLEPVWIDFDEAINIFGGYNEYLKTNEIRYGAYYREFLALCEFRDEFCKDES